MLSTAAPQVTGHDVLFRTREKWPRRMAALPAKLRE
jgi:hypothetical protein